MTTKRISVLTDTTHLTSRPKKEKNARIFTACIWRGRTFPGSKRVRTRRIATASMLLERGVNHYGLPLADVVKMLTQTPADIVGLSQKGRIRNGCDGDIVLFDAELKVNKVFIVGVFVH